ncbi:plasmid replication DNA-binding protein KfrA [Paraburkholderia sp. BL6665CI2N2]|uniref:DNA-binding protein n=1 Tax=Paraburkholderia sp. BL6665CI2N2 TaxID=1938806 RepID=UPI0010670A9E|nr:DNA-binding protein [Paraburkholderia sp. BL6665CI2N2]TDY26636.1 plasmid replication DNA-binding protein KfrA [Paraburkholderia sp. BL6665CI2N2]
MPLEADIEALRERISDTQELYREVCALMFFRHGETPTANKLYQFVRKGSMSAPAKALRDFWAEVRDKTRVDVGQPDLPPEVASAAGELAATLWRLAGDAASAALEVFKQDAQREIATAVDHAQQTAAERDTAIAASEQASRDAADVRRENAKLLARLVELETAKTMLADQLAQSRNESAAASTALSDARREFAEELGKLRVMHDQSEQRLAATEKRALLEIDSERTAARQTRQELQAAINRMAEAQAAHQAERDQLRDALAEAKTQLTTSMARCASVERELASREIALDQQIAAGELLRKKLETLSRQLVESGRPAATLSPSPRRAPSARRRDVRRDVKFTEAAAVRRSSAEDR